MERANETSGETLLNGTDRNNAWNASVENFDDTESFVPQWTIYAYFVLVSSGAVINLIYCLALMRCRRNGTLSLIMQLCATDFLFLYMAAIEVFSLHNHTWIFSPDICPLFNGVETLVNSLTLWFIICLNFHVISLWNLHKNDVQKKNKNPLTSCKDESDECLVRRNENNRTLNIDYRKRKNDVSVILPTLLIWFFCVSLSIPNFALSLTMKINGNYTVCAIADNLYGHILQRLLLILRVLLPMVLLLFALIVLIKKLANTSRKDRNILHFLNLISHDFNKNTAVIFRMPPLYDNGLNSTKSVYLVMLHYSGTTVRAFLYIYLLPKFTHLVRDRIFVCRKPVK
ncbi:hypothetical protein NQ318_003907 [Aromia moschata]|uniref:G-protein coupled receptors family 1 profile domain-containing protein n=1 Tax=Aromia moschata TaxID=1265417 RepID=A0AAV8Z8S9_9CUCU|nr:hypothetical protein NQ318_003907 [Aromia moschata]